MESQFAWNAAFTIGMTGLSTLAILGGKYLTEIRGSLKEQLGKQEKILDQIRDDYKNDLLTISGKVDAIQEDIGNFKLQVQRDFVNREEYVRTTQSLDAKLDRLLNEINTININITKLAAAQGVNK